MSPSDPAFTSAYHSTITVASPSSRTRTCTSKIWVRSMQARWRGERRTLCAFRSCARGHASPSGGCERDEEFQCRWRRWSRAPSRRPWQENVHFLMCDPDIRSWVLRFFSDAVESGKMVPPGLEAAVLAFTDGLSRRGALTYHGVLPELIITASGRPRGRVLAAYSRLYGAHLARAVVLDRLRQGVEHAGLGRVCDCVEIGGIVRRPSFYLFGSSHVQLLSSSKQTSL